VLTAVLKDFRTAPVSDRVKAMLAFLEKQTLTPEALTVDDARALKAAGISKQAAEDAIWVAACFNQIVRIADALGWELATKEGYAASAKFLLKFGYKLPMHRSSGPKAS
jgi:alkylhydroperoxidase family enzyme